MLCAMLLLVYNVLRGTIYNIYINKLMFICFVRQHHEYKTLV